MTNDLNITDGGEVIPPETKVELAKPLIITLIVVSVFVFALGIGLSIVYFSTKTSPLAVVPPPKQNPPMFEPILSKDKSKLATDAAVLKTTSDLSAFQQELNRLDLLEPQLAPPSLDLQIKIE